MKGSMATERIDRVAQAPRLPFSPLRAAAVPGRLPCLPFFVLLALREADLLVLLSACLIPSALIQHP